MEFIDEPLPPLSPEMVEEAELTCGVVFPTAFKQFLNQFNGARPVDGSFQLPSTGRNDVIEQFLGCFEDLDDPDFGWADIAAVTSMRNEMFIYEVLDKVGVDLIPIARLGWGDYLVLDYRGSPDDPPVAVWLHTLSYPVAPHVEPVAENFSALLELLEIEL